MIILIAALIGALLGAYQAKRRKGKLADILQYAAVYALLFTLVGLFATLLIDRQMRFN
jgi:prolipoprotein diacylglyceryltransferase